ncbi:MAG: heme lyase CcmF/NrfE family subunit [Candidatus Methylomirabilia bacterium]
MATVGHWSLLLGLGLSLYGMLAAWLGARRESPAGAASARAAVVGLFLLVTIGMAILEWALLTDDFGLRYVALNSSRGTPILYKISALWGALEGSLLLWEWLLAGFAVVVVLLYRARHPDLLPYVIVVLLAVSAFFLGLMAFFSSPFEQMSPIPADGRGLNPLLENPGMAFHPPTLYLGYVGFTIPYAFAMAGLLRGKLDADWIGSTRRWTVTAWYFLSMGILFGAWWSYRVLGWGGYWAWDPVENASLLPWLTGTAFLHSVMIQERRGMFKVWNLSLIILTFALTLFGTFLTRSGILSSVHAFAGSPAIGTSFLAFIALVLLVSFGLVAIRSDRLKAPVELDSMLSRESAFVLNNVILLAATFSVFFGTVYPLLSEALRGVKASVGAPFFTLVNFPILVVLLLLMGVGPLIAWRRASPDNLKRNFLLPALGALAAGLLIIVFGYRDPRVVLILILSAFVLGTMTLDLSRGVRARRTTDGGTLPALRSLMARNRRRYGGFIVHLGVVVLFVGIAGSAGYGRQLEQTLTPGETLELGHYRVRFEGLSAAEASSHFRVTGAFTLFNDTHQVARLETAKLYYPRDQQPMAEVAIRSTWREDFYLVMTDFARDGTSATVKAMVNPLVGWIWWGGGIITVGTLYALLPNRRRKPAQPRGTR